MTAKANIVVIGTGGTIAGQGKVSVNTSTYMCSVLGIDEILGAIPHAGELANLRAEQLLQTGSENFNNAHNLTGPVPFASVANDILGDYRKVGALTLPHSFTATTKDGGETQSLKFDKIELDVPIDDSRFRMPAGASPTPPPGPPPTPAVG